MMKDKVLNYLGLAARGRMLAVGYNTCMFMMSKRKVKMVVLASDLAENSMKKMVSLTTRNNVPYVVYGTKETLSQRTGKEDSGIFGITDENLAKAILDEIEYRKS
ncbi:MAG: ribosomal L7Ae/L30e/S12e/Gadd45 family protein [Firmicutes bacterium]|nr:ribosomal L7Ae/L30e/S12e/Gadd45 family protein [Bacillota bacterium]